MENRQVAWPCSRLERSRSGFAHLALISPESGPDRALDGTKDTWRWLIEMRVNDKCWLIPQLCSNLLLWQIGHPIWQSHEE